VHRGVRRRRLPGVPRAAVRGRRDRGQLQRRRGGWPPVPAPGHVGPQDLAVLYARVEHIKIETRCDGSNNRCVAVGRNGWGLV
jgi:hypothetical protein